RGEWYFSLSGMCVKIAIANFYAHTTGQLSILSQFKSQFVDHSQQHASQELDIYSILLESGFFAHAFLFFTRHYGAFIYATCFLPNMHAFFAQNLTHGGNFHLL